MLRSRLTAGLAAIATIALFAAPASAKQKYTATIDCGAGPVKVVSGNDMFAPLITRKGDRYFPVAWDVKVGAKVIKATKPGRHHGSTMDCSYDDGTAVGTVTVLRHVQHPRHHHGRSHRRH
jgi:hypothetical protein